MHYIKYTNSDFVTSLIFAAGFIAIGGRGLLFLEMIGLVALQVLGVFLVSQFTHPVYSFIGRYIECLKKAF